MSVIAPEVLSIYLGAVARYYPTEQAPFRSRLPDVQPRFAAAREDFLYTLHEAGRTDDTLRAYWSDLDDLLWWAEERGKDVLALTDEDLKRYLTLQRRRGYAHSTRRRRLTAFRGFYGHLGMRGITPASPTANLVTRKLRQPVARFNKTLP